MPNQYQQPKDHLALSTSQAPCGDKAGALRGWQPIATAPKDGSDVLVWFEKVQLDDDDEVTDEVIGGTAVVSSCTGGGWMEPDYLAAHGSYYMEDWCFKEDPTYWQPLPPPPEVA